MTKHQIIEIFNNIIARYMKLGFDLSYMKIKIDSQPVYNNGEPSFDFAPEESGGSWTKLGYIRINPDMIHVMRHYGLRCKTEKDVVDFAESIIAHELAHEIYNNMASETLRLEIISNAILNNFTTPYLKTVKPNKIAEETFCEYMASEVVNKNQGTIYLTSNKLSICENTCDGMHKFFKITDGDVIVGRYGLSFYDDIKAIGIGSLEVYEKFRGMGYGTKTILNIVKKYKDSYDLIYCFVDSDNTDAIRLYNRIGHVFVENGTNDSNQYYVEFYNANRS